MNAEVFAEWLHRQGYSVIRTPSSYWYEAGARVYQAFPYHWLIQPGEEELHDLLGRHRAIALRYSAPLQSPKGCISYHAVYDKPTYTLEGLSGLCRRNVRIGLKNCRVEPIPLARLAEEGWSLEKDTADRQGRGLALTEEIWRRRCTAAEDLPGFEAWGALIGELLVASLFSFQMGDWCELLYQQCNREYLNARVNHALSFVVTHTMMNRSGIRSIFYALQSLDAPPSVDVFKFRMGFMAKPVRQRVVFHPWVGVCANSLTRTILGTLRRHDPASRTLAKADGMLRVHLQGKRELEEQEWPECLADQKGALCEQVQSSVACSEVPNFMNHPDSAA